MYDGVSVAPLAFVVFLSISHFVVSNDLRVNDKHPSNSEEENWIKSAPALATWIECESARLLAIIQQKAGAGLRTRISIEDLLQDAFIRASGAVANTPIRESEMMGWFMQVISHTVIDAHRHHFGTQKRDARREVSLQAPLERKLSLAELLTASLTSPSQAYSKMVRLTRLQEAIIGLPEDARHAIEWKYFEGLTIDDIASRLGRTNAAVRSLLYRTIEQLAMSLDDARPSTK